MSESPVIDLPAGLQLRMLQDGDIDSIDSLHRLVTRSLDESVVRPVSKDYFARILQDNGAIAGLEADGVLVAYGALQCKLDEYDGASFLEGRTQPGLQLYKLAGSSVHPDWRGMRLQRRLIDFRCRLAIGVQGVFATVSPDNPASLSNFLGCGFQVEALRPVYSGVMRFVLFKSLPAEALPVPEQGECRMVPLNKIDEHVHLLASGWIGDALGQGGRMLRYRVAPGQVQSMGRGNSCRRSDLS